MPDSARRMAEDARDAARALAGTGSAPKDAALLRAAALLRTRRAGLLAANRRDLAAGKKKGLNVALLDRLTLTPKRLDAMAEGLRQVAALPDPVGTTIAGWRRPNGLSIRKVRVPLGVIFMIYESRPNVTVDAGALALKSGNAVILRGGSEAIHSNRALGRLLRDAVRDAGLPPACVQVVANPDRALAAALLREEECIDVVIPRGGKGLIETVRRESRIPVLAHLDGVCHVYVDRDADLEMARAIVLNAKVQRPGVCNAMETLLVHRAVAARFLPPMLQELQRHKVRFHGCPAARKAAPGIRMEPAVESTWRTEYLGLELSVGVVQSLDIAIWHINTYGSRHTDAIVTQNLAAAERFRTEVDASSVMVNASTRFADGFEYGLGAEMGISTNKLHARGPVGLEELTTYKFLVDGQGQIRA